MSLVNRYLSKEILGTLAGVLVVLLLIFTSKHFVRYLSEAAAGMLPTGLIFKILFFYIISSLIFMLPFALYISVLVALGRMYQDSEITAMEACGIGMPRITGKVASFALVFAALVAAMSMWVSPWAERQQNLIRVQARAESEVGLISAGRFHPILNGKGVFYAEQISDDQVAMKNIFIQVQGDEKLDVFSAASGSLTVDRATGDRFVVLRDGYRYEWLPGNAGYRIYKYKESGVRVFQPEAETGGDSRAAMSMGQLLHSSDPRDAAELQWRISMPISAILLALLGVALSRTNPRSGRFAKLLVALILYALYFNMMTVSQSWLEKGMISPVAGLWWVHLLLAALIAVILARQFGVKWRPAFAQR